MSMAGGQFVYSFTYNAEGIRTSKNAAGSLHVYTLEGSMVVMDSWGTRMLLFLYDESGSPIGLQYRETSYPEGVFDTYYFEKNLFGDIVAVYNASGAKIGTYTYDAWGNCTTSTTTTSTTAEKRIVNSYNPFRYRGYFYDTETGLYYLQSRYYNPTTGRFVNADSQGILLATPTGLTDKNLYAYCDNNPVMRVDHDGRFWDTVFDIGSLFFSICDVIDDPTDPWAWGGLFGDAVDLIPFVSGVGEVTRAVNAGRKTLKSADNLYDASKAIDNAIDAIDGTIDTYKALRKADSSIGKEVHHIVEKRFFPALKHIVNTDDMLSIALDKQTHRKFTTAWRKEFKYGTVYADLEPEQIWDAAQRIYAEYPELLEAARKTIFN